MIGLEAAVPEVSLMESFLVLAIVCSVAIVAVLVIDYIYDLDKKRYEQERKTQVRVAKEREAADHEMFDKVERFRHDDFNENR